MPINFELTFVQPLLLDLQNGKFKDVGEFCSGVTKYYVKTIETGMPTGIPPTLPAPAASGAPAPVGTGPGDSFKKPFNEPSKGRFDKAIFAYFNGKELLLNKQNLEQKKKALDGIIRKAKFQKEKIQAQIALIKELKKKIEELPQNIKQLGDMAKEMFLSYKADLVGVGEEIKEIAKSDIDVNIKFEDAFPEEAAVINTITNLEFKVSSPSEIRQTYNNILTVTQYVEKVNRITSNQNQTERYIKQRLSAAAQNITKIVITLLEPDKFGGLIVKFISDKNEAKRKYAPKIKQAEQAIKAIQFIRYRVEPQVRVLEKKVEIQKENIKKRIDAEKKKINDLIAQKGKEIASGKKQSERKKLFKKYIDDAKRLKEENEKTIKTAQKNIKLVSTLTKDGTALLQAGTKLKDDIIAEVSSLKGEFEKLQERTKNDLVSASSIDLSSSKPSSDLRGYLNEQGLKDFYTAINGAVGSLAIDFIDIRKVLERTDTKYDQMAGKIVSLEEQFYDLLNKLSEFEGIPPIKYAKRDKKQRTKKPRSKSTIISILKKLKVLLARIEVFTNKQLKKIDKFTNKMIAKAKVLAKDIETAVVNSLPIPEIKKDIETKRAALEEKKETFDQYKTKFDQTQKKISAGVLLAKNAATVGSNLGKGDFSASKNEQPLKKIANAKFDYYTVGVAPDSPAYKKQEDDKKILLKEIDTLKQIEQLVSIALLIVKELDKKPSSAADLAADNITGFVDELKRDVKSFQNRVQVNAGTISLTNAAGISFQKMINIIKDFAEAPSNAKGFISTIQEIKATVKGEMLSEVLKSVSFLPMLINLEQKYLKKVKKQLDMMVGVTTPDNSDSPDRTAIEDQGRVTSTVDDTKDAIRKKREQAKAKLGNTKIYASLNKMHKVLGEGRGSIIMLLIEEIAKLVAKFETFVKVQINKISAKIKKEGKSRLDKEKKQKKDRLDAILKKKLKNDLIPQTIAYNIASALFWTGAVWQNSTGATFQVFTVTPFKKLIVDGRLKGTAAAVRELAQNFELQLSTMSGLCIPNPATGIPPFPFVGYK
tara:strand:- start:23469 stop:26609 length:3141 start_codon:yes stop_codon:yes gene_type:complete